MFHAAPSRLSADNMNTPERECAHATLQVAVGAFICPKVHWRCAGCGKLLGVLERGVLEVRHAHLVMRVRLPAERRCDRCETWNRIEERDDCG